jgi:hypothetical protein
MPGVVMVSGKRKPATGRVELTPEGFEYAGFYSLKQTEMGAHIRFFVLLCALVVIEHAV